MLKDFLEPAAGERGGPLPESLRDRLKEIPRRVVVCRDHDRLYRAARDRARGAAPDAAAVEHLDRCPACAAVYGALESAFAEELPCPSPKLGACLRVIGRRPELRMPPWIGDSRVATAACLLLAVFLTALADDAAALLGDTAGKVGTHASSWAAKGGDQGRRMWSSLAGALDRKYHESQERLQGFGESCEELYRETVRTFGALAPNDPPTPDGGTSDDPATHDPA